MQNTAILDINEILKIIPHRYPFVLVDKITQLIIDKSITGIKNVSFNEPHFMGHFPGNPIMPGVLIIEALAQVAAILVAKTSSQSSAKVTPFLVGIDNAKFRKTVIPGDILQLQANIIQVKSGIWMIDTLASVEGSKVAEAKIMATLKINQ